MEKNNKTTTSNFSICRKIRQVLATNLALKTVLRMKQQNQEPKPQQMKIVNIEGGSRGGKIPITFDYSMVSEHTSNIASTHVGISERKGKLVIDQKLAQPKTVTSDSERNINIKQKIIGEKHNGKTLKYGLVNMENQGKKSLDINDAFGEDIKSSNNSIRTVSNVGKGQNNHVQDEANSFNEIENLNDYFSEYIRKTKKKIGTTSIVGKTSSFKRG